MNGIEIDAERAQMDWAMSEVVGRVPPPDLLERVRARAVERTQEPFEGPKLQPPQGTRRGWLAAACLLLGVGVLLAVALDTAGRDNRERPAAEPSQNPQEPKAQDLAQTPIPAPARLRACVRTADELRDVSPQTTHLRVLRITGRDFVQFVPDLPDLQELDLDGIDGARMTDCDAEVLAKVGTFLSLQTLLLPGRREIEGAWLAPLTGLPKLEHVDLAYAQIGKDGIEQLARLPSLRKLDLTMNQSFGDDELATLSNGAPGLESITLFGCGSLTAAGLQRLAGFRRIRHADLGMVIGYDFLPHLNRVRVPALLHQQLGMVLIELSMSRGRTTTGVDETVLQTLAGLPELRRLSLSGCQAVTPAGFAHLEHTQITDLELDYWSRIDADAIDKLPKTIQHLSCNDSGIDDNGLAAIAKRFRLIELRLQNCRNVSDKGLAAVLDAQRLLQLTIARCRSLTAKSLAMLLRQDRLIELDTSGLSWIDDQAKKRLEALPRMRDFRHFQRRVKVPR